VGLVDCRPRHSVTDCFRAPQKFTYILTLTSHGITRNLGSPHSKSHRQHLTTFDNILWQHFDRPQQQLGWKLSSGYYPLTVPDLDLLSGYNCPSQQLRYFINLLHRLGYTQWKGCVCDFFIRNVDQRITRHECGRCLEASEVRLTGERKSMGEIVRGKNVQHLSLRTVGEHSQHRQRLYLIGDT